MATALAERIETGGTARLRYHLHPGQLEAWDSKARFILVSAGHQGGKTTFSPLWLHREIETCGPGDYMAATANFDLFKLKFERELTDYFTKQIDWGVYSKSERVIVSHDGKSRIILRSAQAEGGLESATIKAAVLDEFGLPEVGIEAWDAVQRRLSIHRGRALIPTTPYCMGWLKQQVYDRAKGGDPDYAVICFRSSDNPAFPQEEYERLRRTWPDWKFQMMCNGIFTRPAGLIYGDYQDSYDTGNLVKAFPIPKEWLRYVGVDFGGTEHLALIWLARDPEKDVYYAYREELGGGHTGPERAKEALEYKEPVSLWAGGAQSEDQQRLAWATAGVGVAKPMFWEVESGIDRVIGLFKQKRLCIFDTLTGLRSELGTYSRELDGAGEPLIKIADKERFHRLDGLRYIASHLPLAALPDLRLEAGLPADPRARMVEQVDRETKRRFEDAKRGGEGIHWLDQAGPPERGWGG